MTDRELLEAAARAVGYEIEIFRSAEENLTVVPPGIINFVFWNPLINDGDTFRLAVELDISLRQRLAMVVAEYPWIDEEFNLRKTLCEPVLDDHCKSSRRAIVRAAAEIGKKVDAQPESVG